MPDTADTLTEKGTPKTPLVALVPSMITLSGLCFGLFSLKFAADNKWEQAVICVAFAAFIDGFDGLVARKLNATSKFGAELDSLADFFNFAVAPAFISYMWMTNAVKGAGWAVCVFFVMCGAIRLARFNAADTEKSEKKDDSDGAEYIAPAPDKVRQGICRSYFSGIPAPAGGMLCLMPMMMIFYQQQNFDEPLFSLRPSYYMVYVAFIGALMMSRVPTISLKGLNIPQYLVPVVLTAFAAVMITIVVNPWLMLPIIGVGYLLFIPATFFLFGRPRLNT